MQRPEANDLAIFAALADTGSFSRAAVRLSLPKSTVSRRVSALETQLGERLVLRTSRKLAITEFGQVILGHARAVTAELDGALAYARGRHAEPTGHLRVALMADLATRVLAGMLERFVREHPKVTLELVLSAPRHVDLIAEQIDLAVLATGPMPDSGHSAKRVTEMGMGLYASPSYLATTGTPDSPSELEPLHWLMLPVEPGTPKRWRLRRGYGAGVEEWIGIPKRYTLANSPSILVQIAQSGFGIACLPDLYACRALESGELVRILPDWSFPAGEIWAFFPERRLMPAHTRAFLDALQRTLGHMARLECRDCNQPTAENASKRTEAAGTPKAPRESRTSRRIRGEEQR